MYLGLDDTDSPDGMCTTYLGAILAQKLKRAGCTIGELRLIRLNPNVIWKTRGNAAIAVEVLTGSEDEVFQTACELVEQYAEFSCEKTNPGVVLVREKPDPEFYHKALKGFCTIKEAVETLDHIHARYRGYKNGRGLIGALAAVSSDLPDFTYECLTYRMPERLGTPREFDDESFFLSEKMTHPHTWDTVDFEAGTVVCVPHGNDPVLHGVRGDSVEAVLEAAGYLNCETHEFSEVWKTNQGTDVHLVPYSGTLEEGVSYLVNGVVTGDPKTKEGGHVSFTFKPDFTDTEISAFAYEPTKSFRTIVRKLKSGDHLTLAASFSHGSLNLEKFRINELSQTEVRKSPLCPDCGGRMTSAGKGKGYKCRNCSGRVREVLYLERDLPLGWYEVPPGARRHLAKPLVRFESVENITSIPSKR